MPDLTTSPKTLVIGAGVHGLSTAWHLARAGEDVLLVDKTGVGAGASGIACGVVRNNYFQPAMSELMAACVEVWESDPETLHYHGSGYIALGPPAQESDLVEVYERQQRIGYPSELYIGEEAVATHMRSLYGDWRAPGLTVCLHERAGGYAFNQESMLGLAGKAEQAGARIETGVKVTGFDLDNAGAVTTVHTDQGDITPEQVVIAVGPWVPELWAMLGLPDRIDVRQPDGDTQPDLPMWTYWYLQEGEIEFDPARFITDDGKSSPVLHVDSDQTLRDDDGRLITSEPWGVYFKPDRAQRSGRRAAPEARPRDRRGPLPHRDRRARLSRHVVRRAVALPRAVRRITRDVPPDTLGRRGGVHRRQLPGVRLHAPQRVRGRRLQPRLQDDRGGAGDRPRPHRRALLAAAPVPLRALRHRGAAPRVAQPVPLELTAHLE